MVSLIELDQILADAARLTGARRSPARTQSLREALEAAVSMLGEEIEAEEPHGKRGGSFGSRPRRCSRTWEERCAARRRPTRRASIKD